MSFELCHVIFVIFVVTSTSMQSSLLVDADFRYLEFHLLVDADFRDLEFH